MVHATARIDKLINNDNLGLLIGKNIMKNIILATLLLSGTAFAQDVSGTWAREDGSSRIRFANCGSNMCGTISWTNAARKDDKNPDEALRSRSTVGVQVFYAMQSSGTNTWSGKAYNPEDGKTYSGKMTLAGNKLTTQGCALGGLVCKSTSWSRVN
jgi:uncharacterized protein (DUF2147 family)